MRAGLKIACEGAIAALQKFHTEEVCLLGKACPTRLLIHQLRDELAAETLQEEVEARRANALKE